MEGYRVRRHPVTRCVVAYWVLPHPTSSDALNRLCNEMHSFYKIRIFKFSKSTATLFYSITHRTAKCVLECNAIFSQIFKFSNFQFSNFPIFSIFQFFNFFKLSFSSPQPPSVRPHPPTPRSQAVPQHSPSSAFSGAALRCGAVAFHCGGVLFQIQTRKQRCDGGFTVYSV